jgi:uncharacterized RDD family membrane protein YckC
MSATPVSDPPRRLLYAGFAPRLAAHLVDTVLTMAVVYPLLFAIYGPEYFLRMLDPALDPSSLAASAVPSGFRPMELVLQYGLPAVAVILFWTYRAATPGKMLLGTRIVDARTGGRITASQSLVRYLAYVVALLPLGLGFLWVLIDPRGQGWHDKLAGTVVVREGWVGTPATFHGG